MSLLNYFSYSNTKNKHSSSSLSSVPLPTSVPSLLSRELEVTNAFVEKAITATTAPSTASRGKYNRYTPEERAAIGKYAAENGPVDISSADRKIRKSDATLRNLLKIWRPAPSGTRSYGRLAGRQAG